MDLDFLKSLKKTTEKNLAELSKKPDMTAAETKAAKDAMELLDYLDCKIEECKMEEREKEYSQYSGHDMDRRPFREYQITSYRAPHGRMSFDGRSYGNYYDSMDRRSYTDRPMSNGMNYYSDPYFMGYSGHSIGDRAVSLMEGMFDEAKSDYERKQVGRFIEMIRAASQQMQ